MIRARIPTLLLSLVPWLIAAPTWGQQPPDRAPIPARTPQQLTAPAQSPKLVTVFAATRRISCRPSLQTSAAAEGRADCAPGDAWTCPVEVELRRSSARPAMCSVQCTLATASAQCECTIDLDSCKTAR